MPCKTDRVEVYELQMFALMARACNYGLRETVITQKRKGQKQEEPPTTRVEVT